VIALRVDNSDQLAESMYNAWRIAKGARHVPWAHLAASDQLEWCYIAERVISVHEVRAAGFRFHPTMKGDC
jgi:hypothetical protein